MRRGPADAGAVVLWRVLTAPTIDALAGLHPATLGLMDGPAYTGDCESALRELAAACDQRLLDEGTKMHGPVSPV